jgi:hypothetical protein
MCVICGFRICFLGFNDQRFPEKLLRGRDPGRIGNGKIFLERVFPFPAGEQGVVEVAFAQKDRREIIVWEFAR